MAKPTVWMPIYWNDYLRDTAHLSTEEHGAYLLLIAHYWNTGKALPDDEKYLRKICKISPYKWRKSFKKLSAFFVVENGRWHHARIERELLVAFGNKAAATAHGKRGAAGRWRDLKAMPGAMPEQCPSNGPSPSPIKNHESLTTNSTDAARDPALNGGSGPRAHRETGKERLLRLAEAHRQRTLKGEA